MLFRITLADQTGISRDLTYRLNDLPITQTWVGLVRAALTDSHRPMGFHAQMSRTPEEVAELRAELYSVTEQAVREGHLPAKMLKMDMTQQDTLNTLHAARHQNETNVPPSMDRLNILIHTLEGAVKKAKTICATTFLCGKDGVKTADLPENCKDEFDRPLLCGDLALGYGTIGKRLRDCFGDNDVDAVRKGLIRPQKTITAEFTILFGTHGSSEDRRRFHQWCEQQDVEGMGYPWRDTVHGTISQPVLGHLAESMTHEEARSIMASARLVVGVALLIG